MQERCLRTFPMRVSEDPNSRLSQPIPDSLRWVLAPTPTHMYGTPVNVARAEWRSTPPVSSELLTAPPLLLPRAGLCATARPGAGWSLVRADRTHLPKAPRPPPFPVQTGVRRAGGLLDPPCVRPLPPAQVLVQRPDQPQSGGSSELVPADREMRWLVRKRCARG